MSETYLNDFEQIQNQIPKNNDIFNHQKFELQLFNLDLLTKWRNACVILPVIFGGDYLHNPAFHKNLKPKIKKMQSHYHFDLTFNLNRLGDGNINPLTNNEVIQLMHCLQLNYQQSVFTDNAF